MWSSHSPSLPKVGQAWKWSLPKRLHWNMITKHNQSRIGCKLSLLQSCLNMWKNNDVEWKADKITQHKPKAAYTILFRKSEAFAQFRAMKQRHAIQRGTSSRKSPKSPERASRTKHDLRTKKGCTAELAALTDGEVFVLGCIRIRVRMSFREPTPGLEK